MKYFKFCSSSFLLLSFFFLSSGSVLFSQEKVENFHTRNTALDTDYMQIVYKRIVFKKLKDRAADYLSILNIGENYTLWQSYSTYLLDSLLSSRPSVSKEEYFQLSGSIKVSRGPSTKLWVDLKTNCLTEAQHARGLVYYQEECPKLPWSLSLDTDTVCAYLCKKATANFRGRQWEVWYTEDIPLSVGPWKFFGLPGLVLKAKSVDGEHEFIAETIKRSSSEMYVPRWARMEKLKDREQYIKSKVNYYVWMANSSFAVGADGRPLRKSEQKQGALKKNFILRGMNPEEQDIFTAILKAME